MSTQISFQEGGRKGALIPENEYHSDAKSQSERQTLSQPLLAPRLEDGAWFTLLHLWNKHNIVNQLYSNKLKKIRYMYMNVCSSVIHNGNKGTIYQEMNR